MQDIGSYGAFTVEQLQLHTIGTDKLTTNTLQVNSSQINVPHHVSTGHLSVQDSLQIDANSASSESSSIDFHHAGGVGQVIRGSTGFLFEDSNAFTSVKMKELYLQGTQGNIVIGSRYGRLDFFHDTNGCLMTYIPPSAGLSASTLSVPGSAFVDTMICEQGIYLGSTQQWRMIPTSTLQIQYNNGSWVNC